MKVSTAVVFAVAILAAAPVAADMGLCYPFASYDEAGVSYTVHSCCPGYDGPLLRMVADVFANASSPATSPTSLFVGAYGWNKCPGIGTHRLFAIKLHAPLGIVYASATKTKHPRLMLEITMPAKLARDDFDSVPSDNNNGSSPRHVKKIVWLLVAYIIAAAMMVFYDRSPPWHQKCYQIALFTYFVANIVLVLIV